MPEQEGLSAAVSQLYALPPEAFTAARNQLAGRLAAGGDKELGKAVRSLPKPTAAAWLVNALALNRPSLMHQVLELGAALREAQEDLDQQHLRRLSGDRQRLLRSAAREAGKVAAELGRPASPAALAEAEQTLWAAMTDVDAAAVAASGQLVRGLTVNGWDPVDLAGVVADPGSVRPPGPIPGAATAGTGAGSAPAGAASPDAQRGRKAALDRAAREARTALADAHSAAERAEAELRTAQQEVDDVAARRDALTDEIDELRGRISELDREVAAVDRRAGTLERARDTARRTARAARRAVEKAQARLEGLG